MNSAVEIKQRKNSFLSMAIFAGIFVSLFSLAVSAQSLRPRVFVAEKVSMQAVKAEKKIDVSFEVRYRLLTMKDYTVFDWLEAKTNQNGEVTLRGQVTDAATKEKAEQMLGTISGIKKINNQIEVLPLSDNDKVLRKMLYRAVYNQNTSLSRYALVTAPSIHIIVKNGQVDLRGAVDTMNDSELAFVAANAVPRVARVTNNLKVSNEMIASVVSRAK